MKNLKVLLCLFLVFACTKEEFTQTNTGEQTIVDAVSVRFEERCTNFTPPPLDVLILIDNTDSRNILSGVDLKQAVTNILGQARSFYDYRIYIAPLVPNGSESDLMKRSYQLLSSDFTLTPISTKNIAPHQVDIYAPVGTQVEHGFKRVEDLIKVNSHLSDVCHDLAGWNSDYMNQNLSNRPLCLDTTCGVNGKVCTGSTATVQIGNHTFKRQLVNGTYYRVWRDGIDNSSLGSRYVFRRGSHLTSIIISNGDDNDFQYGAQGNIVGDNFYTRKQEFLSLKTNLESTQLRFLSAVNHSTCGSTISNAGDRYKAMSSEIYSAQGYAGATGNSVDSFDLCSSNFSSIFTSVGQILNQYRTRHKYNYWPLGETLDFDVNKLVVKKKNSGQVLTKDDLNFGYRFDPISKENFNIREFPLVSNLVPAENYNGYFLELLGSGKVEYPDCLVIRKENFTKYYGYINLDTKPKPETIQVYLDGNLVSESATNGWEYIGWVESQNMLVISPTNPIPLSSSDDFRSGYMLKLNGQAIINDNAGRSIDVRYIQDSF